MEIAGGLRVVGVFLYPLKTGSNAFDNINVTITVTMVNDVRILIISRSKRGGDTENNTP